MKCPVCGEFLCWGDDEEAEDIGCSAEGIISFYHCEKCGVDVEIFFPSNSQLIKESEEEK